MDVSEEEEEEEERRFNKTYSRFKEMSIGLRC
jgi:hypothetical protein